MPEINDYSEYDEFKTPGLYTITNSKSGTLLDLPKPAAGIAITGMCVFQHLSIRQTATHRMIGEMLAGTIRSGRLRALEIAST